VQLTCLADQLHFARRLLPEDVPLALEAVDLGCWVRSLVHAIAFAVAGTGHRLRLVSISRGAVVLLDGRSFELALLNLLDNAQKFAPQGTAITVLVRRTARSGEVHVADEGPGLPPGLRIRPFGRIDVPHRFQAPGMGLGLSIAEHVARLHGGRLGYRARDTGRGASVGLEVPLVRDD
jgi:K+-sensing histidine kinase KdpD